jgi:hypothetical protein
MKFLWTVVLASSLISIAALPLFAGVTVNTPVNGSTVSSPFTL